MSERVCVNLRMADSTIVSSKIEISHDSESGDWTLVLDTAEIGGRKFKGSDLFEAVIELRKSLEHCGVQLLCAGARHDVFPSGMSRGMGGGRYAYSTRIGQPARREDIVPQEGSSLAFCLSRGKGSCLCENKTQQLPTLAGGC